MGDGGTELHLLSILAKKEKSTELLVETAKRDILGPVRSIKGTQRKANSLPEIPFLGPVREREKSCPSGYPTYPRGLDI